MYYGNELGCLGIFGLGWHMIIPSILVVIFIYFIIRSFSKSNNINNEAIEILNKKYVNGEISEEEYLYRKKTIKN